MAATLFFLLFRTHPANRLECSWWHIRKSNPTGSLYPQCQEWLAHVIYKVGLTNLWSVTEGDGEETRYERTKVRKENNLQLHPLIRVRRGMLALSWVVSGKGGYLHVNNVNNRSQFLNWSAVRQMNIDYAVCGAFELQCAHQRPLAPQYSTSMSLPDTLHSSIFNYNESIQDPP